MHFYVYTHKRESDGVIFYVGKGRAQRAWSRNKRNAHWWAVANKHGVSVDVVERFETEAEAFTRERTLIAECRSAGIVLTNKTDGGEGPAGMRHSEATRAKWRAARLGKKRGPYSAEHRGRIAEGLRGKPVPDERRRRIADATRAAMKSPEIVAKMRAAKLGKKRAPHSEETKAKMRAAWGLRKQRLAQQKKGGQGDAVAGHQHTPM